MDLRGASLLVLCLLFKVSHQVSIGLVYSFYHFESNPVCRDIEPGVCCRALYTSRPYIVQQVSLMGVWFRGLEAMDLATAWGSTMTNWGCSGTVLDSALGAGYNYFEVQDPWLLNSPPMTGASYLRLSPASASMAFAQGIKAFLAGGAKAACSILGVDFKGHSKRDGQSPLTAPVKWMWPNMVTLNGSNYTEFGGIGSLRYRNDIGEELDFPELRAEATTPKASEIDSEPTYCEDEDGCGGLGSGCDCGSVELEGPMQSVMFGGRKSLGGFCVPTPQA